MSSEFRYRGARALVRLHETQMRRFLACWRRAEQAGVRLPETDDPDFASLDTLLRHVVVCARGYLTWMCDNLGLPDPGIRPVPDAELVASAVDGYLEHLLERWREPLCEVAEERFWEMYEAPWGAVYSIDAMLEHAVMHPARHTFQLEELLGAEGTTATSVGVGRRERGARWSPPTPHPVLHDQQNQEQEQHAERPRTLVRAIDISPQAPTTGFRLLERACTDCLLMQ